MSKGFVYALHAGDLVPRYVGMTRQKLDTRLAQHRRNGRSPSRIPVRQWTYDIGGEALRVLILEEVPEDVDLGDREKFHVARLKAEGASLLNGTTGGQRGAVGYVHSPEQRAIVAERMKGNRLSVGAYRSPEYREKMRDILKGKRCVEGCTCKRHSPEPDRGAKISAARRKPRTP